MTGLLRVELLRLRSRRFVRFAVVALLLGLTVALGKVALDSNRDVAAARAAAQRMADEQFASIQAGAKACEAERKAGTLPPDASCNGGDPRAEYAQSRKDCLEASKQPGNGNPPASACGPARFEDVFFHDPRFSYAEEADHSVLALSVVLALLSLAVGATFLGAEWQTGTMAGLLAWEPRRLRVLGGKALALALAVAAASVGFILLTLGAEWLIAATRGNTAGATSGLQQSVALTAVRGTLFAAGAALLGAALGSLLRNTAAVLGLAFAYFAAAEIGLRAVWHGGQRWLLTSNIGAFLDDGMRLVTYENAEGGNSREVVFRLTLTRAATVLGLLLAAGMALSAVAFRRRDIT